MNYVRPYLKKKQKKVGFLKYFVTEIDDKQKEKCLVRARALFLRPPISRSVLLTKVMVVL